MTEDEVLAGIAADWEALEQIAGLVYELYARVLLVEDASGPVELGARVALAHGIWTRLDELGVDLTLPDLKTLFAQIVASTPTSSGAGPHKQPLQMPDSAVPSRTSAGLPHAPLEPTDAGYPTSLTDLTTTDDDSTPGASTYRPNWKPGDACSACESTNTTRAENGAAHCIDCGAHDVDEDHE